MANVEILGEQVFQILKKANINVLKIFKNTDLAYYK